MVQGIRFTAMFLKGTAQSAIALLQTSLQFQQFRENAILSQVRSHFFKPLLFKNCHILAKIYQAKFDTMLSKLQPNHQQHHQV
ncbi:MAG: hypothetical protein HC785_03630 [Calothrix sp. CSU_2_0]|nr:hypothetical protein [Calothrix sp. CSU_2_0]